MKIIRKLGHHSHWKGFYIMAWQSNAWGLWKLWFYTQFLGWDSEGVRCGIFNVNLKRMMMNTNWVHPPFIHHVMTGCMLRNIFPELPFTSFSLPGLVQVIRGEPLHLANAYLNAKQNAKNVLHHSVPEIITLSKIAFLLWMISSFS